MVCFCLFVLLYKIMVNLSIIVALDKIKNDHLDSAASQPEIIAQNEANVYLSSLLSQVKNDNVKKISEAVLQIQNQWLASNFEVP